MAAASASPAPTTAGGMTSPVLGEPMKILFLGWRYTYFRNFESVLQELAERGHQVHLAVEEDEGRPLIEPLVSAYPNITCSVAASRADDDWSWAATRLRFGLEYLRYQHRMFDDTPKILARSRERTPGLFVSLGDGIRRWVRWARRPMSAAVRWLERSVPDDPGIRAYLEAHRPDAVLITPLITLGSAQIDYLRAARALGIPTALCVWSWDHLSSKALIREAPDRVFVWNDTQKREAVQLHDVQPASVVVTGAQCFDKWFDRRPSRERAAFCAQVGLPEAQPYILYVCSAPFVGSQPEAPFVVDWVRRLRAQGSSRLAQVPVLIRPHPSRRREWEGLDLSPLGHVVLWGDNPVDAQSRDDYFDSLYHSAVVVGLNTSAFIEAGIVGRPVYTILLPEWHESQLGTVHFRYLFDAGGGLLTSATTFDEHLRQLDEALAHPSTEIKPFVREFVRPRGLDVPATPYFADMVEGMQGMRVGALQALGAQRLAHLVIGALIARRQDQSWERWLHSERELESIARFRAFRQEKLARDKARIRARVEAKAVQVAERRAALQRHRQARRDRERAEKEAAAGRPSERGSS